MCAAVGVIPVTVISTFTVRSGLISTVPLAEPVLVTGGNSLAPDNVTCWLVLAAEVAPIGFMSAQPAIMIEAPTNVIINALRRVSKLVFMVNSFKKAIV